MPATNTLGSEEGERLLVDDDEAGAGAAARRRSARRRLIEAVLDWTRSNAPASARAFDQTIADFQNTQFVLADLKARSDDGARVHRRVHRALRAGRGSTLSGCRHGQALDHVRAALRDGGRVPAIVRRLGLRGSIPIARALCRCAGSWRSPAVRSRVMKTIIARAMFKGRLTPKGEPAYSPPCAGRDCSFVRNILQSLDDPEPQFAGFGFLIHDVRLRRIVVDRALATARVHALMVGSGFPLAPRRHDPDRASGRPVELTKVAIGGLMSRIDRAVLSNGALTSAMRAHAGSS